MSTKPQFLSGDRAAIDEFLSKFDVRFVSYPHDSADRLLQVFLFDCDGTSASTPHIARRKASRDSDNVAVG